MEKDGFHPHTGSKGSVSEKDLNISVKGNNDIIKVETPKLHWTKELEKNKIIRIDDHDIKMIYGNRKPEGHFFDKDTMRFFDSRLSGSGYKLNGIVYFITSEQQHESQEFGGTRPRKYTIRVMNKEGNINDIGGFQKYQDSASAKRELSKILEAELKNVAYVN